MCRTPVNRGNSLRREAARELATSSASGERPAPGAGTQPRHQVEIPHGAYPGPRTRAMPTTLDNTKPKLHRSLTAPLTPRASQALLSPLHNRAPILLDALALAPALQTLLLSTEQEAGPLPQQAGGSQGSVPPHRSRGPGGKAAPRPARGAAGPARRQRPPVHRGPPLFTRSPRRSGQAGRKSQAKVKGGGR